MAVSKCPSLSRKSIDPGYSLKEPTVGEPSFPMAVYHDDLKNDSVLWHWHEEFEIGCVTEGRVLVEIGSKKHTLTRGDIYFVNSEIIHAVRNESPGSPAAIKALVFHGSIIGGKEDSVFHQKYVLPITRSPRLKERVICHDDLQGSSLFPEIIHLWQNICDEEQGYELFARDKLSGFFQLLLPDAASYPITSDEQRAEDRAKIMLDHIHSHYSEPITLGEIAGAASVSVSEALRCFKVIVGMPPIQYLKRYRIQLAASYIKAGGYSIRQICDLCGFSDSSYFSKSFKEAYHCAPRDYQDLPRPGA